VIGVEIAVLVLLGWRRWLRSLLGTAIGFIVVAGPWMLYMQWRYSSPVFPFYNSVFGAPSATTGNFDDARFGANSIRSIAEFPAEMLRGTTKYSELQIQDWRFIVACALLAGWLCWRPKIVWTSHVLRAVVVTLGCSFVIWITTFGVYRYFLFGEVLASTLVAILIFRLFDDKRRGASVCAVVLVLGFGFTQAPDWGRGASLSSPDLREAVRRLPSPPSLVMLDGGPPLSYLLGDFPDSTTAASLAPLVAGEVVYSGQIKDELDALVEEALEEDAFYTISDPDHTTLLPPFQHLALTDCMPFVSNGRQLQFCRVRPG
jgi:hypothetical protein